MAIKKLDKLVTLANEAAEKGDWSGAIELLSLAEELEPNETGVLSGLGACLLQMGNAEEAVPYFSRVVDLEPHSVDACCNLGMAYSATGQLKEAEEAFKQALVLDSNHVMTRKNLAVLYVKQDERLGEGLKLLVDLMKDNPKDLESVLMLASYYLLASMNDSAYKLCQYALSLEPDNPMALQMVDRINEANAAAKALNQILEPNPTITSESLAPDASAHIARPEHAQKLAALKGLGERKKTEGLSSAKLGSKPSVLFIGGNEYANGVRLITPATLLAREGYTTQFTTEVNPGDVFQWDIVVFSRPHLKQDWVNVFTACKNQNKRIIVDIDEDYFTFPHEHPGYNTIGEGNQLGIKAFKQMLQWSDVVTVSSLVLKDRYQPLAPRVEYIASGWDSQNAQWEKPAPTHRSFNIGWMDYASEIYNLSMIAEEVTQFVRENKRAMIVIGGDLKATKVFNKLPDDRIMFLPFVNFEDYPFILAHFDVVISPFRKSPYNMARSDMRLVEAGIRRTPWVASNLPSYQEWGEGGLIADKPGDWYNGLKKLHENETLRKELGENGREKAEERKGDKLLMSWKILFESLK